MDGGLVRQTVVELDHGLLVGIAISRWFLPDRAGRRLLRRGVVPYEMTVLVTRTGAVLTPSLRAELQAALPP